MVQIEHSMMFFFIDENKGWSVGCCGTILKTEDGGISFVEMKSDENIPIPNDIVLLHNYPNPFNSATVISFNLSKPKFVMIKIYNILDEEIETIINGWCSIGVHKNIWNPKKLPSGIYLVNLKTVNHTETKKIILQR